MGRITSERVWSDRNVFCWGSVSGPLVLIETNPIANVISAGNKTEVQSKTLWGVDTITSPPQNFQLIYNERFTFNFFNTEIDLAISSTNILTDTVSADHKFYSFVWVAPTEIMDNIMDIGISSATDMTMENQAKRYALIEFTEQNFVLPYQFLSRSVSYTHLTLPTILRV